MLALPNAHLIKNTPLQSVRLGSSMLRSIVVHIYSTEIWQSALLASPSRETVDRDLKDSTDSIHWSAGAPPRLVAFAGTIVSLSHHPLSHH